MVPVINNKNNTYDVVIDFKSDDDVEEKLFDEDFDVEMKAMPRNTISTWMVWTMEKLQAL